MQPLQWEYRPDGLRAPALICAFKGWNDAADAASTRDHVRRQRARRPPVRDDRPRGVLRLPGHPPADQAGRRADARRSCGRRSSSTRRACPRAPRDLILLAGSEPSFRWRTFSKLIVELAEALGAQLVVTLGALLADVPHTRPVSVTGLASDPALVARLGLTHVLLRGPDRDRRRPARRLPGGRPAVGEPVGRGPALHRRRARTRRRRWRWCASSRGWSASRSTPPSSRRAAADYERQVNLAVQSDPDVQAFVERLEQAAGERGRRRARPAPLGRDDRARPAALPAPARQRRPAAPQRLAALTSRRSHDRIQRSAAGHTSR